MVWLSVAVSPWAGLRAVLPHMSLIGMITKITKRVLLQLRLQVYC